MVYPKVLFPSDLIIRGPHPTSLDVQKSWGDGELSSTGLQAYNGLP